MQLRIKLVGFSIAVTSAINLRDVLVKITKQADPKITSFGGVVTGTARY